MRTTDISFISLSDSRFNRPWRQRSAELSMMSEDVAAVVVIEDGLPELKRFSGKSSSVKSGLLPSTCSEGAGSSMIEFERLLPVVFAFSPGDGSSGEESQ